MRTSHLLAMTAGASALLMVAPGCRKKAEPPEPVVVAPPPPPTPPEPPPPPCPSRDAMLGTWFLVTQVSDDVGGNLAGVNGYYTVRVHPGEVPEGAEDTCETKLVVSKDGWGRGSNTNEQRLFGNTTVPEGEGFWKMPLELGMGDEKTDIVFFVQQDGKTLSGYWHYMNASWKRSPIYGIVEGRKEKWEGKAGADPSMHDALSKCGLAGLPSTNASTCSGF